jgi:DNA repair protein RecO (recombination protein O)
MLIKAEGLVLRSKDYGEGNKIVTIFSPDLGKVSIMARGAKKPKSRLSSISQPFTYGTYLFYRGSQTGMGSLSQGEIIDSFRDLRQDLSKTAYAAYFAELLDKLVEDGEKSPLTFDLLLTSFRYLDDDKDAEILARLYEIKMLTVGGYRPELNQCVSCGSIEGTFGFSVREGGFLCDQCLHKDQQRLPLQLQTLKLLRLLYHFDIHRLGNINVKHETKEELRKVLWLFMDHHTPLRLKSRSFLEKMADFL